MVWVRIMCTYSFDLSQKVSTNRKHLTNHNKVSCAAQGTGLCVGLHNKLFLQFAMQRHTVSKITLSNLHGHTCWNMSSYVFRATSLLCRLLFYIYNKSRVCPKLHQKNSIRKKANTSPHFHTILLSTVDSW